MEASQCSIDGFSLFGVFFLGLFIALMGGLISKDKESRRTALIAGFGISVGGVVLVYLSNCL